MSEKGQIKRYPENTLNYEGGNQISLKDRLINLKDDKLSSFHKKTVRVVSAVYLLTGLLDTGEPLRIGLKKSALGILNSSSSIKNGVVKNGKKQWLEIWRSDLLKISSLLETSFLSGLVSEMNFRVIKSELEKLFELARSYVDGLEIEEEALDLSPEGPSDFNSRNESSGAKLSGLDIGKDLKKIDYGDPLDNLAVPTRKVVDNGHLMNRVEKKDRKNKRQIKILDVIKDIKEASIKDISDKIKDCSEKTIQRELILMVNGGVLKKEGERRWSRYSLNL